MSDRAELRAYQLGLKGKEIAGKLTAQKVKNNQLIQEKRSLKKRVGALEAQNKILSDSIKAGTNIYKSKWESAEEELDRAADEIHRLGMKCSQQEDALNQGD